MALAILFVVVSAMTLTHGRIIYPLSFPFIAVREIHVDPEYSFAYDVNDPQTGDIKTQTESRKGDIVLGEYSLIQPDGVKRTVEYRADDQRGFTAVVSNQQSPTSNFNFMSHLRIPERRRPDTNELDASNASPNNLVGGKQNKVLSYGESNLAPKKEADRERENTENQDKFKINNRNDNLNSQLLDSDQVENVNSNKNSFISDFQRSNDAFSPTSDSEKYPTEKRFDTASSKVERFQKNDPDLTTYEPVARSFVLHSHPRAERLWASTQQFD